MIKSQINNRIVSTICIWGILSFLLSSCGAGRHAVYFKDMEKDTTLAHLVPRPGETRIVKGDLLSITVTSLSPENTIIYNAAPNVVDGMTGYLVDSLGDIRFIKLGALRVTGMTKTELSRQLQENLEPYLGQSIVSVGILNRHITMMGGVSAKVIPLTRDMTLLDALAQSGDIGEKGRIDNVLIVRSNEEGTEKTFKRINLNEKSLFYSPYFYLQPDDIVYVEPKKQGVQTIQIISLAMTTVTFILFTLDRIFR